MAWHEEDECRYDSTSMEIPCDFLKRRFSYIQKGFINWISTVCPLEQTNTNHYDSKNILEHTSPYTGMDPQKEYQENDIPINRWMFIYSWLWRLIMSALWQFPSNCNSSVGCYMSVCRGCASETLKHAPTWVNCVIL